MFYDLASMRRNLGAYVAVALLASVVSGACRRGGTHPTQSALSARTPLPKSVEERQATATPSCETPGVASVAQLHALDMEARVGTYQARDAQWAPEQPVLVGRDFNFALAAMDDLGAGVAAAQRRHGNQALAQALGSLEPLQPTELFGLLRQRSKSTCLFNGRQQVAIYGIVYGSTEAALRTIVESVQPDGSLFQHIAVSAKQPAEAFTEPGVLGKAVESGLGRIAVMMATDPASLSASRPAGSCSLGGTAVARGQVLQQDDAEHTILRLSEPAAGLMACPAEAFKEASPAMGHD
jgi:hypothetical protein